MEQKKPKKWEGLWRWGSEGVDGWRGGGVEEWRGGSVGGGEVRQGMVPELSQNLYSIHAINTVEEQNCHF